LPGAGSTVDMQFLRYEPAGFSIIAVLAIRWDSYATCDFPPKMFTLKLKMPISGHS